MKKEMVISTPRINSYGSRILTEGIDTSQFERNPILLWMHFRWDGYRCAPLPIGRVENLRREGNALIGTPVFDTGDDFARLIKNKWESGILKMCSPGIEILETSNAPKLVMPGQTRETITRCKLVEVSIVDIGANDDALQLHAPQAGVLTLSKGEECNLLPLLKSEGEEEETPICGVENNNKPNYLSKMTKEQLSLLGLTENATEEQANAALELLRQRADNAETIELAAVTQAVEQAVKERRIVAEQRDHFIELGKKVGLQMLSDTLAALHPQTKPTEVISLSKASTVGTPQTEKGYTKLSDVPSSERMELRKSNPAEYMRLYKAEYGTECPELKE